MGSSSKVILVGATSLIVGVYAISLKRAETDGVAAAMKQVKRVQNERTEDAAMRAALSSFVKDRGAKDKSGTVKAIDGTNFTYAIKARGTTADVTVTVLRDGVPKVITAKLTKKSSGMGQGARKIRRGDWEITESFVR
jgi:hypothetical protein